MNDVHMLQSKHPVFQSSDPTEALSVPLRCFLVLFHPHRAGETVPWGANEPVCSLGQLSHSPWILLDDPSLLQREGLQVSHLCSSHPILLLTLMFRAQHACVEAQCTTALLWYGHIHDTQVLLMVRHVSCVLFVLIMGISGYALVQVTSSCLSLKNHIIQYFQETSLTLGYNYLNLPTGFSFKLPYYGYWII